MNNLADWDRQFDLLIGGGGNKKHGRGDPPLPDPDPPATLPDFPATPATPPEKADDSTMTFASLIWILQKIKRSFPMAEFLNGNPYNVSNVTIDTENESLGLTLNNNSQKKVIIPFIDIKKFINERMIEPGRDNIIFLNNIMTNVSNLKVEAEKEESRIAAAYILIRYWAIFVSGNDEKSYKVVMKLLDHVLELKYFIAHNNTTPTKVYLYLDRAKPNKTLLFTPVDIQQEISAFLEEKSS